MSNEVWYRPSGLRNQELCPQFENSEFRDKSAAERGTRIHKAIETADYSGLNEEEMECAAKCLVYKDETIGVVVGDDGSKEVFELAMQYPPLYIRGTADYVQFRPNAKEIILADWKTGRKEVEEAQHNFQMQCYAFMLLASYEQYDSVECHLVTPLTPVPASAAVFTRADMAFIAYRIERAISGIGVNPPTPYVGVCDWCGNKAECPALKRVALMQAEAIPLPEPIKLSSNAVVTPSDRAKLQILAGIFEDWAKQVKAANTAAVVQDGVEIPGFVLRSRGGTMSITDAAKAVSLLKKELPEDRVLSCANLSLPKLAELYAAEKGGNKKESRKVLEIQLKDVLVRGEPVVYLQQGRAKSKGKLIDG